MICFDKNFDKYLVIFFYAKIISTTIQDRSVFIVYTKSIKLDIYNTFFAESIRLK